MPEPQQLGSQHEKQEDKETSAKVQLSVRSMPKEICQALKFEGPYVNT